MDKKTRIEMIGSPVTHVRTPSRLHILFGRTGENIRVTIREVGLTDLAGYMAEARRDEDLAGLVVTMPVKSAICAHLTRRTALVELIGSSNCVRFDPNGAIGANFDGIGCVQALEAAGHGLAGKRVFLSGCGGAGKSIAASVAAAGAAFLDIFDPDLGNTAAFAHRLQQAYPNCAVAANEPGKAVVYDIVINASPVGLEDGEESPVPRDVVAECGVVMDIVVLPTRDSALARCARELGKTFVDGGGMVDAQTVLFRAFLLTDIDSEDAAIHAAAPAE